MSLLLHVTLQCNHPLVFVLFFIGVDCSLTVDVFNQLRLMGGKESSPETLINNMYIIPGSVPYFHKSFNNSVL